MSFFDSEVVRAEMAEITELQEEVYRNVFQFPTMNNEDKLEHINILQKLLQKQKILYTRLSLSEDPEAQTMKKRIMDSAVLMGLPEGVDMNIIFSNMERLIDVMKSQIDETENT